MRHLCVRLKLYFMIDHNELEALLCGYWLSDISNFAAYVADRMSDVNWVGFYLDDGAKLRLASFIGKPACLDIAYNRGVCGYAFTLKQTVIVDDVHQFPGHIACDERSRSEMVIPFFIENKLVGVLDIDSPSLARFTLEDKAALEKAVMILSQKITENTKAHPQEIFGRI